MPVGKYSAVKDRVEKMLASFKIKKFDLLLIHWPGAVLELPSLNLTYINCLVFQDHAMPPAELSTVTHQEPNQSH